MTLAAPFSTHHGASAAATGSATDLTALPVYRRLWAQYTEAAARAVTEDDLLRFRDRRDRLSLLPHRVADDPGALRSMRHLLDEESRRMTHWIALQISHRLR